LGREEGYYLIKEQNNNTFDTQQKLETKIIMYTLFSLQHSVSGTPIVPRTVSKTLSL